MNEALKTSGKTCGKDDLPLLEEDQVSERLNKLDIHNSMGLDGMHT